MFRHFSFDPVSPPAYHLYEAERAAMNCSPTSRPTQAPCRPPTPPCTVGDLAVILNQQTLRIDPRTSGCPSGLPSPPMEECESSPQHFEQTRPTYSRVATSLLRIQRQANSRMQCCTSHIRDISHLVKMIEDEEQCNIYNMSSRSSSTSSASSSSASSTASSDDEAIDMDYDKADPPSTGLFIASQWTSAQRNGSAMRVARPVRMRKPVKHTSKITKRRSS